MLEILSFRYSFTRMRCLVINRAEETEKKYLNGSQKFSKRKNNYVQQIIKIFLDLL